jgi:hypothetical protein
MPAPGAPSAAGDVAFPDGRPTDGADPTASTSRPDDGALDPAATTTRFDGELAAAPLPVANLTLRHRAGPDGRAVPPVALAAAVAALGLALTLLVTSRPRHRAV